MFSKPETPDGLYAPLLSFGLTFHFRRSERVQRVSNKRFELDPPWLWFPPIVQRS